MLSRQSSWGKTGNPEEVVPCLTGEGVGTNTEAPLYYMHNLGPKYLSKVAYLWAYMLGQKYFSGN